MKKLIPLLFMAVILSGCSFFYPHKQDVEQGNIFTMEQVDRLHVGMSEGSVKEIMGDPISINTFDDNRLNYIYTMSRGHGTMHVKRVLCSFRNGRLVDIQRN